MPVSDSERQSVARQLLKLVDLSRDLDRNLEDGRFHHEGGELIYVVDENIYEMFVRPSHYSESIEAFYGDSWSTSGRAPASWRLFETQSALIASEFLLSGAIPGSVNDRTYLTEPHYRELLDRVDPITDGLRRDVETQRDKLRSEIKLKFTAFEQGQPKLDLADPAFDGAELKSDLSKLEAAGIGAATIDRLRAARRAAFVLSSSEILEPLDQVRRIVSHPMRRRLRSLEADFAPSGKEWEQIESDAVLWEGRLAEELRKPGHRRRQRAERARLAELENRTRLGRAIQNDARSVAYLRWLSTKLTARQRLVFVTADHVLFDAYRRWHSEILPDAPERNEYFMMRRAVQFSPVFNPEDFGGDLSSDVFEPQKAHLFGLIQSAVEAILLPLTLIDSSLNDTVDGVFSRQRELLALNLVDSDDVLAQPKLAWLSEFIDLAWDKGQADRVNGIRDIWQELQRLSIASCHDLLMRRMDERERALLAPILSAAEEDDSGPLQDYASNLFDRIVDDGIHLWRPVAERSIVENVLAGRAKRLQKRLTISLHFGIETADEVFRGPADTKRLPPEIVFAWAAKTSLELQDVNNGERFAGLAIRADDGARQRAIGQSGFNHDLRYLNAVAQRYLIATVREHLGRSEKSESDEAVSAKYRGIDQVKYIYSRATRYIHRCLSAHYAETDHIEDQKVEWHRIRYYRALSERAALNLFMSTSLALTSGEVALRVKSDAENYLRLAQGDLRLCANDFIPRMGADELSASIRDQILPNIAAAEVLRRLIVGDQAFKLDEWSRSHVRAIEAFAARQDAPHALLVAELSSFFLLAERHGQIPSAISRREEATRGMLDLKLPLDRMLLREIRDEIL